MNLKLSKSRLVFLGVLGLAVVALLVDRVMLDSPSTQPAAAQASPVGTGTKAVPAPAPPPPPPTSPLETATDASRLAERLKVLAAGRDLDPTDIREAFAVPKAWLPEVKATGAATPTGPSAAETFAQKYRLTSLIIIGTGGTAVVNGKAIRLGQELDGFTLVSLEREVAVFQAGAERVELKLRPKPDTP